MGSVLKKLFTTGQTLGADNYPGYAPDLDSNFSDIESDINALEARINSVIGTNAVLAIRGWVLNDPSGIGIKNDGVLGEHSFRASVSGGDLNLTAGVAVGTTGAVVEAVVTGTVVSAGLSAVTEYYISLDQNGVASADTAPGQGSLDVAKCTVGATDATWNAATLIRAGEDQADAQPTCAVFWDGDDYAQLLNRDVADAAITFPTATYRTMQHRIVAIERMLSGEITDPNTDQTKPVVDSGELGPPIMSIMNTTERNLLTEVDGMVIWNSTQAAFNFRQSGAWKRFPPEEVSDLDNAITFGVNVGPTAHGLDADPEEVWCYIKCQTAELGYVAEDRVFLVGGGVDPTDDTGVEVVVHETANTIEIVVGATGISVLNLTTGVRTLITAGFWEISFGARSYASA